MSTVTSSQLALKLATVQGQKRAAGSSSAVGPAAPEINIGLSFAPGTRVVDLVSGEQGVIIAGTITSSLVQPAKPDVDKGAPGQAG